MRSPEKAGEWAKQSNIALFALDVTDTRSIEAAIEQARAKFNALDVVVNNAGYGLVGPFEASTPEQVERQFRTNVLGLMNVTRAVIPHFRERRSGVIIQVASMGGRLTFPLYSAYHGTKWAVEGFSESLQFELDPFNVRVKIVEPGPIKTDFYDRSIDLVKKPGLTAYDRYVDVAMNNMNKTGANGGTPEEVAQTIFRAATDGSKRLRYPVHDLGLLLLRRLIPESWFRGLMASQVLKGL
jgi:NAD(P)-dependent dehydrogenase (short-subunit alcohol dehydrogenase family)